MEPQVGGRRREDVFPANTRASPSSGEVISHLLLTFQITSWSLWPFSWNLEKVESSVDYPFLLGEGASQPDPSDLQIPSPFQLLESKSPVKIHLRRTVQTHSWTQEWLLLKLLRAISIILIIISQLRKWGKEGWENPGETPGFLLHGPDWEHSKAMLCTS